MRAFVRPVLALAVGLLVCAPIRAEDRAESTCASEGTVAESCPPGDSALHSPVNSGANHFAGLLVIAVALGGALYVHANERWRRTRRSAPRQTDWNAYVTGALMGLLITGSMVLFGRPVGASGAVQNIAGVFGHRLTPGNDYWGQVIPIGVTWQVWVFLGLIIGGFVGATLTNEFAVTSVPSRGWKETWGASWLLRWTIAFTAAALIEFASGIAGGCTSGLALSGGVVLSPAAFAFMAAMFATGVPTALLVRRWRGA